MWIYVLALIVMSFNAYGQLAENRPGCYASAVCDGQLQWTKLATSTGTQIANSSSTGQCAAELRRISESIKSLTQKLERLENSLRATTVQTTEATTTQSTITVGDQCKGSTVGGCFWTDLRVWRNYNAAKSVCESNGSVVAVPRNEYSYRAIMQDISKKINKGRVVGIWLGMTRITNTQDFTPADAFYKWKGHEPKSANVYSGVYIHVNGGNYNKSGLAAYNPNASQTGVACWKPRIAE